MVQLPSFRNFSYTGSAWVPDGGTTSLAGGGSSASSSISRGWGPYGGRATGSSLGASSLSASVQIIDLQALDDAILNANVTRDPNAKPVISAGSPAAGGGRSYLSGIRSNQPYEASAEAAPDPNLWRRVLDGGVSLKTTHESQVESDIRYYLRAGKQAEKANRVLAARVYYRMAVEAMTPEMVERYHRIIAERKAAEEEKRKAQKASRVQF